MGILAQRCYDSPTLMQVLSGHVMVRTRFCQILKPVLFTHYANWTLNQLEILWGRLFLYLIAF